MRVTEWENKTFLAGWLREKPYELESDPIVCTPAMLSEFMTELEGKKPHEGTVSIVGSRFEFNQFFLSWCEGEGGVLSPLVPDNRACELQPSACTFCGSIRASKMSIDSLGAAGWAVRCCSCWTAGPTCPTKKRAIKAWNKIHNGGN